MIVHEDMKVAFSVRRSIGSFLARPTPTPTPTPAFVRASAQLARPDLPDSPRPSHNKTASFSPRLLHTTHNCTSAQPIRQPSPPPTRPLPKPACLSLLVSVLVLVLVLVSMSRRLPPVRRRVEPPLDLAADVSLLLPASLLPDRRVLTPICLSVSWRSRLVDCVNSRAGFSTASAPPRFSQRQMTPDGGLGSSVRLLACQPRAVGLSSRQTPFLHWQHIPTDKHKNLPIRHPASRQPRTLSGLDRCRGRRSASDCRQEAGVRTRGVGAPARRVVTWRRWCLCSDRVNTRLSGRPHRPHRPWHQLNLISRLHNLTCTLSCTNRPQTQPHTQPANQVCSRKSVYDPLRAAVFFLHFLARPTTCACVCVCVCVQLRPVCGCVVAKWVGCVRKREAAFTSFPDFNLCQPGSATRVKCALIPLASASTRRRRIQWHSRDQRRAAGRGRHGQTGPAHATRDGKLFFSRFSFRFSLFAFSPFPLFPFGPFPLEHTFCLHLALYRPTLLVHSALLFSHLFSSSLFLFPLLSSSLLLSFCLLFYPFLLFSPLFSSSHFFYRLLSSFLLFYPSLFSPLLSSSLLFSSTLLLLFVLRPRRSWLASFGQLCFSRRCRQNVCSLDSWAQLGITFAHALLCPIHTFHSTQPIPFLPFQPIDQHKKVSPPPLPVCCCQPDFIKLGVKSFFRGLVRKVSLPVFPLRPHLGCHPPRLILFFPPPQETVKPEKTPPEQVRGQPLVDMIALSLFHFSSCHISSHLETGHLWLWPHFSHSHTYHRFCLCLR
ncbi:unnamed protein product [Protopolystoma xenopodis]|uniref:Uncharacterized protein n=1 Tax=Protopolystoma xenopodis TaxID=117903 RepID=A0A3S5C6B4_9PLAT|nr:unnamed protein product [Protopolystoma xenopodis]